MCSAVDGDIVCPRARVCVDAGTVCLFARGTLPVTPSSLRLKGHAGEAAPCRDSKETHFPATFLDTFPFTQLRLERHGGRGTSLHPGDSGGGHA